jgi:MFS transporter, DHA1 family, multidrug resistance protein
LTRTLSERGLLALLAAVTASGPVSLGIYMPVVPLARAAFSVSVAESNTTVTAALVAYAIGLYIYGPLSDRYGRRPLILVGIGVYLAGLMLAWNANSIGMLAVGRVIAALGTSAGVTVARAVLGDLYARDHMALKLATLTMAMGIATALAPAAGGVLGESFGWRSVFAVLFGSGVVIFVWALRCIPETLPARRKASAPLLRSTLALLTDAKFLSYAIQSGVLYAIFFVFVALVPYIFQHLGRSPSEYGYWYLLISAGYFCGNWFTTRRMMRFGTDRLMTGGILLQAAGAAAGWLLAIAGYWQSAAMFVPWMVIGFAQGLSLPSLTASAVGRSPDAAGTAIGLMGFTQQIIGAFAVQAMSTTSTRNPIPVTGFIAASAGTGALFWILDRRRRWRSNDA